MLDCSVEAHASPVVVRLATKLAVHQAIGCHQAASSHTSPRKASVAYELLRAAVALEVHFGYLARDLLVFALFPGKLNWYSVGRARV